MKPQVKVALILLAAACLAVLAALLAHKMGPPGGTGTAAPPSVSTVTTLQLKNEPLPPPPRNMTTLAPAGVGTGSGKLIISVKLPKGYKVNEEAPTKVMLRLDGKVLRLDNAASSKQFDKPTFPLAVPIEVAAGEATATADLWVYYCREGQESACFFKEMRLQLLVRAEAGRSEHELNIVLEVKR